MRYTEVLIFLRHPRAGPSISQTRTDSVRHSSSCERQMRPLSLGATLLALHTFACIARSDSLPETVLFVDDADVIYRPQTERVLHAAERPGGELAVRGVMQPNKPWEAAIGYTSLYHAPPAERAKTGGPAYFLWYQACPPGCGVATNDGGCVVCLATSDDGYNWTKPKLGLHPAIEGFNGTVIAPASETNIVLGSPPEQDGKPGYKQTHYGASVYVEPWTNRQSELSDPRRFKMAYWAVQGGYGVRRKTDPYGIFVAFSPDGYHWTRYTDPDGAPQIIGQCQSEGIESPYSDEVADGKAAMDNSTIWPIPFGAGDVVDVYFDPVANKYVAQGKTNVIGPDGKTGWKRGVVRAESPDFVSWSYPQLVLSADEEDLFYKANNDGQTGIQLHSAPAFHYPLSGHHFGLMQKWNSSNEESIAIELITSRDGIKWERPFRDRYFLPCSPTPSFDGDGLGHCSLWTSSTPQLPNADDPHNNATIRFYYGAYYHGLMNADHLLRNQTAVGLATIPVDRFAGLKALQEARMGQAPTVEAPTFCLPNRPCSAPNGSMDKGTWETQPCKTDSDCPKSTCNGNPIACSGGLCGANSCTGTGAGAKPGTVGCGVLCRCKEHATPGACVAPQAAGAPKTAYGQVTLRPRQISSSGGVGRSGTSGTCELLVNADTTDPGSAVSVEILDLMGFRVRGFGANGGSDPNSGNHEAVPITGVDALGAPARWRSGKSDSTHDGDAARASHGLDALPPGTYMTRVYLAGNATLYSLTFAGC